MVAKPRYLLPIIRGGANNQVIGLKEVLAMGRLLSERRPRLVGRVYCTINPDS